MHRLQARRFSQSGSSGKEKLSEQLELAFRHLLRNFGISAGGIQVVPNTADGGQAQDRYATFRHVESSQSTVAKSINVPRRLCATNLGKCLEVFLWIRVERGGV